MSEKASKEAKTPLLEDYTSISSSIVPLQEYDDDLARRFWVESKKLWHIVGPSIFSRVASYAIFVITQAFAGHLSDLDLAAISIVINVLVGFDIGLMVILLLQL